MANCIWIIGPDIPKNQKDYYRQRYREEAENYDKKREAQWKELSKLASIVVNIPDERWYKTFNRYLKKLKRRIHMRNLTTKLRKVKGPKVPKLRSPKPSMGRMKKPRQPKIPGLGSGY